MIYERKQYMAELIRKRENGRIKIITGIRRCGKSYLLFELFRSYLSESGIDDEQIIELALDEFPSAKYRNPMELDTYIRERIIDKSKTYFVMIDEIQFVKEIQNPYLEDENAKLGFIDVLLGLMKLKNVDIYVTGRNSVMLSGDILTQFRDRGGTRFVSIPFLLPNFMTYTMVWKEKLGRITILMEACPTFRRWKLTKRRVGTFAICFSVPISRMYWSAMIF